MNEKRDDSPRGASKLFKSFLALTGALAVGGFGSGVWDVLFKPGMSAIATFLASRSVTYENEIYISASLDPRPLSGLLLLSLASLIPLFPIFYFLTRGVIDTYLDRREDAKRKEADRSFSGAEDSEILNDENSYKALTELESSLTAERDRVSGKMIILSWIGVLLCASLLVIFQYAFSIHNESVLVWRVFHRNMAICSPVLSEQERREVEAKFASMASKNDFVILKSIVDKYSKRKNINLDWYGL